MRRRRKSTLNLYISLFKSIASAFKKKPIRQRTVRGNINKSPIRKTTPIMKENTILPDFRPKTFDQIVGQEIVKEYLKIKIQAFKKSRNAVGHCLFLGFSGSGKTTMANVMANEMVVRFHSVMATRIKTWNDFSQIIDRKRTRLNSSHITISDVVFCLKKNKTKIRSRTPVYLCVILGHQVFCALATTATI